ncbi:MAG TPA: TSUP family transporter [Polyangiaceae bacterium]|nr:TSUP family transporter [Polyangiaceae bacterium]
MNLSIGTIALLAAVAFVAGVVDGIAGGGGLISLPALLAAGLPPHIALGTNKGQSTFGTFSALIQYARAGLVDPRRARWMFPLGFAGSLAGAALVLLVRPDQLRPLVLVLLIGVAAFLAFRPPVAHPAGHPPPPHAALWAALIALVGGLYDGFFGPGAGTFLIVALVGLVGLTLTRATAEAKVVNWAANFGALIVFASRGVTVWRIALPMAAGSLAGGYVGAHVAMKGGDRLVRYVVLAVVTALVAKQAHALYGS